MQQKVADQQEALEIAMKLETAPVGDDSGIAQIQAQLATMALELREMKKGKPDREEVLVYAMSDRRSRQGTVPSGKQVLADMCAEPLSTTSSLL